MKIGEAMEEAYDIWQGDCRDVMREMPEKSVDAIVTDPPYGLSFMGKEWDHGVPGVQFWTEAIRVAKPGAHLLAFGGTRTFHRLTCAIEDAGWEIRDCVMWVYGSGFPKSHNLQGQWAGWGTALKPAWEPIIVARKPLAGTVAENVLAHGTGAMNIDGCRVAGIVTTNPQRRGSGNISTNEHKGQDDTGLDRVSDSGRWPANVIHDGSDDVVGLFPQTGPSKSSARGGTNPNPMDWGNERADAHVVKGHNDNGGSAARFFYCAKASKVDRDAGCEGLEAIHRANGNKWTDQDYRVTNGERPPSAESGPRRNHHPTVKPTDLMRYLCRLVTPPGGVVLDPFMGSGSTGKAAMMEGFRFIGIDLNPEYIEIAEARIKHALKDKKSLSDKQEKLF